ncbi:DUF742 domain-containing protein [Streptomyces sp. AV19]|uniref:DUF742 domain-containing protein n=1 Tax=Streptomyces sp. AV19 TaxID=2793068 RepID=UPI0018FEFBD2|nr:DUF742 domain-containing protein [Streptomyces sp. AV19]MBH1933662.1 DUF742 domain-containing protein [Streptomyces sp. AV19]MDG4535831.1 DUF742 domain-containing protein [Streptomyces sp. AV19]
MSGTRTSARVRPYSFTGGRPPCGHVLQLETFVQAPPPTADGEGFIARALPEVRAIVGLCRGLRSVAEVSALLKMPLGVVRVLLGDLADQGRIRVYGPGHGTGRPDRALLERVQCGLRRI